MTTKPKDPASTIVHQLTFNWGDAADGAEDEIAAAASASSAAMLASFRISVGTSPDLFHSVDQAALVWARSRAAELVGMRRLQDGSLVTNPNALYAITEGTREFLRGTISTALAEGWSAGQLRQELLANYAFSNARALNIARSEITGAHAQGGLIAARAAGMASKSWLTGAGACDDCIENQDAGIIPVDEEYPSGDDAPGAHPSCRCTQLYYPAGDEGKEEAA